MNAICQEFYFWVEYMTFSEWLKQELRTRNWSQLDLLNRMGDYQISQAQLSRIISGGRDASAEVCIGIAHALGIPREEVFRIRGWLLYDVSSTKLDLTPDVVRFAMEIDSLPTVDRELALKAARAVVHVLNEHRTSPTKRFNPPSFANAPT